MTNSNAKGMIPLSVVIITYNESPNIMRCIQSVKAVATDILIVDSGSTDNTVALAKEAGARVVYHPFEGHIEQKNFAITQATYPHILSLDADEALDEEAANAIKQCLQNWDADGYTINRLNHYCGRFIRHGAWYPDVKLRLWDSRKGQWAGINPHDCFAMQPSATIKHLPGHILHYSYNTITEHREKIHYFSSIAAKAYYEKGKRSNRVKIILHPISRFMRDYILRAGFMDGRHGWIIARLSAKEVYLKYEQLLKLQKADN